MKRNTLTLVTLLTLMTANAATYYCSPTGTADGTSKNTPCSFSSGVGLLSHAGDTLYLLEGVYYLQETTINKSGSKDRNIVIAGYPGEKAILDFRKTAYGKRGLKVSNSSMYLHIKDLTLRYSGKNNLYNEGSYCTFENLDIYGSADTGCQMKNGGHNLLLNVDSHDNFDYQHTGSDGSADYGGNADGFADKQHNGASNTYVGCRAWNNSDDGWDFFDRNNSADSEPTVIEGSVCYQNGPAEYNMKNHPRYETDKAWFDNINGKTITNRYGEKQVVSLEHYPNHGNGNGFKLGGNSSTHNVTIHHSLSVANTVKGFDQNNNAGTMRVYNNTGYKNGNNMGFHNAQVGTLYLQNCISFQGRGADMLTAANIVSKDHNSWDTKSVSCSAGDFQSLDTTEILRARNEDGSLREGTLLRLKEASAMVDAGIYVGYSYYNMAPDMGCYELVKGEKHDGDPLVEIDLTGNDTVRSSAHSIAFVTIAGAQEDKKMLSYLRSFTNWSVYVTDAMDTNVDYSEYELIIISPKPSSSAAGLTKLKGYPKPMMVLKPFLLKNTVWNWGTAVNTQDISMHIVEAEHPLFDGIETTPQGQIQVFSQCNTNAVTAINGWTKTEVRTLATPTTETGYCAIAELESGTDCNGTILQEKLLMIGISEYSTENLTSAGLKMLSNGICYMLNISETGLGMQTESPITNAQKRMTPNGIVIYKNGEQYTLMGQKILR